MARTLALVWVAVTALISGLNTTTAADFSRPRVSLVNGRWHINGRLTNPGSAAEGLLMNVRMVNATFEDRRKPDFDAEANTDRFMVCNEDDKVGERAVAALQASVANGCAYGLMLKEHNQTFPFPFDGAADDPVFYAAMKTMTSGKKQAMKEQAASHGWPEL